MCVVVCASRKVDSRLAPLLLPPPFVQHAALGTHLPSLVTSLLDLLEVVESLLLERGGDRWVGGRCDLNRLGNVGEVSGLLLGHGDRVCSVVYACFRAARARCRARQGEIEGVEEEVERREKSGGLVERRKDRC